jgi:hypothetical protein
MTTTPRHRYTVRIPVEQPGFYYVWDTVLDSLETSFLTLYQACDWADRLNNDPTVAHLRRPVMDDMRTPKQAGQPVVCSNTIMDVRDTALTAAANLVTESMVETVADPIDWGQVDADVVDWHARDAVRMIAAIFDIPEVDAAELIAKRARELAESHT